MLCQASPRPSPSTKSASQGTQQPPPLAEIQLPTEGPNKFEANAREAVDQSASPVHRFQSHGSQPTSPRDTPSVESFTQSQLGDDERSEESEPRGQGSPSRTSNLYLKNGLDDPNTKAAEPNSVMLEDDIPIFLQETPTNSYIRVSRQTNSPRSTTGSNNTPTRTAFTDCGPPATRSDSISPVMQKVSQQETEDEVSGYDHTEQTGRFHLPSSNASSHVSYYPEARVVTMTNRSALDMSPPRKQSSGDSKSTIRKVAGDDDLNRSLGMLPVSPTRQRPDSGRLSHAPAHMTALDVSHVPSTATDARDVYPERSNSRPVSSPLVSSNMPRPSVDYSMRGPSIDSSSSRIDLDRPPSPLSPSRPTAREVYEQRGYMNSVQYGHNQEFPPDFESTRRTHPRTHSGILPSQDAQRSSVHGDALPTGSNDVPPQPYPGRPSQDVSPMLRQKAPEYQIEGMGSPIEWPSESQSRSRRGSRSSAFFKSLNIGKLDEPPLPNFPDAQKSSSPINLSTPGDRKSKRSSIFRSLTGNSGSGSASAKSKDNVTPAPNPPTSDYTPPVQHAPPPSEQVEDDEFPSRGPSRKATSKFSQRLQKPSKSNSPEQEGGKKKRFSGIGVSMYRKLIDDPY